LTVREVDIVTLVLQGRSNLAIAELMGISKSAVKWHMHNIFAKSGTSNREELLREMWQLSGLIPRASVSAHTWALGPAGDSSVGDRERTYDGRLWVTEAELAGRFAAVQERCHS
jgi:DNA-binding CsgD family transcriptional regulator